MKNLCLAFLLSFFAGCTGNQQTNKEIKTDSVEADVVIDGRDSSSSNIEDFRTITCEGIGPVKLSSSLRDLEKTVGTENIRLDSLFLEGDFESVVTVLWRGTPKEVRVYWNQREPPFTDIKYLEISNRQSVYQTKNGIKPGILLSKLVSLNGNTPITLYGFGWDYGGTFVSFNNGTLAKELPCFGGVFELSESQRGAAASKIMGDHHIKSDEPDLAKLKPMLRSVRITKK